MGVAENDPDFPQTFLPVAAGLKKQKVQIKAEGEEQLITSDAAEQQIKKSPKKRKNFKRSQHHFIPRDRRRSSLPGLRPTRRKANLEFLINQLENLGVDGDIEDFIEFQPSAFSELFEEEEKMSAWNDFINSSEDEQLDFLKKISSNEKHLSEGEASLNLVGRCHNAYLKINHKIRHFLSRKQLPKGELERIESELVEYFLEWPSSVYETLIPDSFRRMMLHAASQYMDLEAISYDCSVGRRTKVESKSKRFRPPEISLVSYLEMIKC